MLLRLYTKSERREASQLSCMQKRGKTFYWACRFLPTALREDFSTLYTFCRYVDDAVDEATSELSAYENVERIEKELRSFEPSTINVAPKKLSCNLSAEPIQDFLRLAQKHNINIEHALALTRGVSSDIGMVRFDSQEQLIRYCYQVASTVGVMICQILKVRSSDAIAFAIDLGIAMQLTNIARDVVEDFNCNRIYLPASLISHATVERAILYADENARCLVLDALCKILQSATTYYRSADQGISFLPVTTRLGILAASRAYEKIGDVISAMQCNYWSNRATTSLLQKQFSLCSAAYSISVDRRYRSSAAHVFHEPKLHNHLRGLPSFENSF